MRYLVLTFCYAGIGILVTRLFLAITAPGTQNASAEPAARVPAAATETDAGQTHPHTRRAQERMVDDYISGLIDQQLAEVIERRTEPAR